MYDTFAEIDQEFADAWDEINDGWIELEDGKKELADGKVELAEKEQEAKEEIADARKELEDAYVQLNEAWVQLNEGEKQLNIGEAQLEEAKEELRQKEAEAKKQLAETEALLNQQVIENETTAKECEEGIGYVKFILNDKWTAENETLWETYVQTVTGISANIIMQQMQSRGEVDKNSLMQEIENVINNTPQVSALKSTLEIAIDAAVYNRKLSITSDWVTLSNRQQQLLLELDNLKNAVPIDENAINNKEQELLQVQGELAILSWGAPMQEVLSTGKVIAMAHGSAICTATELMLQGAMAEFKTQKEYALAQIEAGWAQIEQARVELEEGRKQLSAGRAQVIDNYKKWQDGVKELDESEQDALREIADAWEELAEGELELIDGEQELIDGEIELKEQNEEYRDARADAEEKIADAKQEVADIDMTKWYVQDRTSLSGYVNVDSDTSCIESLSTVFTIVFFVVAILISLTTVTRMVEEERGLIGTYKALGFTDGEIRRKYVVYAAGASVLGAIIGDVGGFVVLPEILFIFFRVMYVLPTYVLKFEAIKGTIAGLLFIVGIVGAAFVACYSELKHVPAQLMRPKAPKEGSRVFLEYIKPLWKRMSFLNKVTARNLFRYKKRMFMTLFGIMGCTALLVFGLAIKDSVDALMPLQYENVYSYDLLAATSGDDNDKLVSYVEDREEITKYLNIQVETVKLKNEDKASEKVQLMVLKKGADISQYFSLMDENLKPISIGNTGIYLTENASRILNLKVGDTAYIQKLDLSQEAVVVTSLVKNYLGNNIYMSQEAYEEVFGEYEPNGILANLSEECVDQIAFAEELASEDWILSSVSTEDLKATFSQAFTLINIVVYVVLVLAACLAFVVLFTLASINISERERELATIKVLGFFDKEVHSYVNKETLILTIMGILLGLPVGTFLSSLLTDILNMPSIYFAITIYNRSYWIAAGIALGFAFIVQFLTDRSLDVIDPVEALKSVE